MINKPREIALKVLYNIEQNNLYSNIILNKMLNQNKKELTNKDIAFITELVYGITYWKLTLDEIIKKYSKIRLKKISCWVLNILRMGIYQIIFLDKIPKSAAVNESVNLAKRYGHTASSNFVNAILRKITDEDYKELFSIKNQKQKISKTTSMPEWIIDELLKDKNIEEVEKICNEFTKRPNLTIRINNLKISNNNFKKELKKQNIDFVEFTDNKDIKEKEADTKAINKFLEIKNLNNIENMELFKNGYFTMQDISAGFAAILLHPKENDFILDACAAPGGKTTFIAELMNNKGKIYAFDIYEHRLNLIKQNAKRLGINIIEEKLQNASEWNEKYFEKFDKILLDVPCSGIGVIKRKPDIKWQRNEEELKEITMVQSNILEICSKYLKNNGTLVYSTCSIFSSENENIIKKFLKSNKNFKIQNENLEDMKFFEKFKTQEGYYKINPTAQNDGFFMCKLIKSIE